MTAAITIGLSAAPIHPRMIDLSAIRTMPDDLAAARAKAGQTRSRLPRYTPPKPLFPLPTSARPAIKPRVNLPTGERREKAQVSALAVTLAIITLILGGLIALIVELT